MSVGEGAASQPLRVGILGGGPAGAFCALWLSHFARARGTPLAIAVYDYRNFEKPGPAGCNMCAGILPDSLVRNLHQLGAVLPERVIQRRIAGYHLHTRGGAVDLPAPSDAPAYATFRGPGPLGMYPTAEEGFDWWLLSEAAHAGALHVSTFITDVRRPEGPRDPFLILSHDGTQYEADLVVGACGVNSNLIRAFEQMGFGYRPPRTQRARQAELPLDPEFITRVLRDRVVILAMGWPGLRFAAFTPKRRHLTVTLIGDDPSRELLARVLDSPEARRHFPKGWEPPERTCTCTPRLPISAAAHPAGDRVLMIGDANISRYLKNGIESSFHTARWAAEAILSRAEARAARRAFISVCRRTYARDNWFGRTLFRAHDLVSRSATITEAHLSVVQREQASGRPETPLSRVLMGLFTGSMPYRQAIRTALRPRLQCQLAVALLQTLCRRTAAHMQHDQVSAVRHSLRGLGPVGEGQTVVVIGGGPAGTACALALARSEAPPHVALVEAKRFGEHHNQCAGLLSPPGPELLAELLGTEPPEGVYQRCIVGYVLHGARREILLDGRELGELPTALRRVELDRLLLDQARAAGVEVVSARATEVEVGRDGVVVYTEGDSVRGDVVVGAFALDETMARTFARHTRYRPPPALETLTCKLHPKGLEFIPGLLGDAVHVFLPRLSGIEFGALLPKGNHITVIIAGAELTAGHMDRFLSDPQVACLLPRQREARSYFKGAFPIGPARGAYGDRYVIIGDAAGLVRPFKGKGINCALEGGLHCAETLLTRGLSARDLAEVPRRQRHLSRDLWYGRAVRHSVAALERLGLVDAIVAAASGSAPLRQALFDSISGRTTYRDVLLRRGNATWLPRVAAQCLRQLVGVGPRTPEL